MRTFNYMVDSNGVLPELGRRHCATEIAKYPNKHIKIKIWEAGSESSDKQRKYYFSVIVPAFIKHFAIDGKHFDKEQMHDSMMRFIGGFNNPYVNPFTGEPDSGRLSYNDLTTAQAEGYHTLARKWAAENGFDVPEPKE